MGFTKLTEHALQRLTERCSLQPDVMCEILDKKLAVHMGYDPYKTEVGIELFYSRPDDSPYIALQNLRNGLVVTIVPLSFHRNKLHVTPAELAQARWLAQKVTPRPNEIWLKVRARYIDDQGQFAAKTVMHVDATAYNGDVQHLRDSFGFDMSVRLNGIGKGIDPFRIVEASIQRMPMGEPVFFDLATMTPTQRMMLALRQRATVENESLDDFEFVPSTPTGQPYPYKTDKNARQYEVLGTADCNGAIRNDNASGMDARNDVDHRIHALELAMMQNESETAATIEIETMQEAQSNAPKSESHRMAH